METRPIHDRQSAVTCRWAQPTLFLGPPLWLDAQDTPWTCVRDTTPQPLDSTGVCADCRRWEARVPGEMQASLIASRQMRIITG
jgi:hypothetical protein